MARPPAKKPPRTKKAQRARFKELQPGAYTISTFCVAHDLSESFYHKLKVDGLGPREMRIGARVLISHEAAAAWRAEREAATAAGEATEQEEDSSPKNPPEGLARDQPAQEQEERRCAVTSAAQEVRTCQEIRHKQKEPNDDVYAYRGSPRQDF
jgi:hypothetical protein